MLSAIIQAPVSRMTSYTDHITIESLSHSFSIQLTQQSCVVHWSFAMSVPFKLVASKERGQNILEYQGFRYRRNKITDTRLYWKCGEPECKITLITTNPATIITKQAGNHDHPEPDVEVS